VDIDGLKISNSQVKRLERELKNLKEEVREIPYNQWNERYTSFSRH
jgi:hypothetical protein